MRKLFILLALLPVCFTSRAQESHIHRNIGLDSLMTLMQSLVPGQVYYVKDAVAENLVFTINLSGSNALEKIKESVEKKGYSISEYNNDLYILRGLGLNADLPTGFFKVEEKVKKDAVEQEKTVQYTNILTKNIKEATGGDKVYQIGDKRDIAKGERVYLSGYVRSYITGEPVVGVTILENGSKAFAHPAPSNSIGSERHP